MLPCFKPQSPPSANNYSPPASQGYSVGNSPRTSAQPSPTINLTQEYARAIQTDSYSEIRQTFDEANGADQTVDIEHAYSFEESRVLEQVLQPNQEYVNETLSLISTKSLSNLVANYFGHSEDTTHFCYLLYQSVRRARQLYIPIHQLLDDIPLELNSDSYRLSQSQCSLAYNVFVQFDRVENPFLSPDSQKFEDMRRCFSDLRQELEPHVRRSKPRIPLMQYFSARPVLCVMAAGAGVAISAVAVATHFAVALVGSPICLAFCYPVTRREEKVDPALLDAAAKNAYVLHKDLDTIERLVAQLCADVEGDMHFIRLGLERGDDSFFIQEMLKQLRVHRQSFVQRLESLEDHLFLCFYAIKRTRSQLIQEIHLHQNNPV
ncbi:UPF0496 protein At3g19330-like [Andrographis paniculata]|uniref:UPF0496 protein At3g19330-like n=1 Tax=Andrographis paniculata TaxID=175694 RepID=UPI0021E7E52F|nr:UPF0496 protein At3g19330-like [Andrographis paniculata]XP_051113968.1 UPF0496 protein At3g19330-like [Andrographis paniculata]